VRGDNYGLFPSCDDGGGWNGAGVRDVEERCGDDPVVMDWWRLALGTLLGVYVTYVAWLCVTAPQDD